MPISPDNLNDLPPKQREVLEVLAAFIQKNGYPPSIQQLCERCGVRSTSTIHYHLMALKKKGFIHWNEAERRSITLLISPGLVSPGSANKLVASNDATSSEKIPVLGAIAAGSPLQTVQDTVEYLDLSNDLCPPGCYALRVRGNSMIDDHILDGDMVLINPKTPVRDGDIVVALVEGETATLKRLYRETNGFRLQPANASMEPIYATDVQVQGKLEAIIRSHP